MTTLRCQHLSLSYGEYEAIRDVSFSVKEGEILTIIGPNGSGKSTILRGISKLLPIQEGEIFLWDRKISDMTFKELACQVGKEAEAKAFVEKQKAVVEKILADNKDVEPKKVLFLFGSPKAIMVGTQHSYVGSLLKKIGVINIADQFPEIKGSYAPLNLEEVVKAEPDMILRMTHASPEEAQAMFEKEFSTNEIWKEMKAVKEGKVYDLDINTFGVSGNIHIEEAFNQLEEILFK